MVYRTEEPAYIPCSAGERRLHVVVVAVFAAAQRIARTVVQSYLASLGQLERVGYVGFGEVDGLESGVCRRLEGIAARLDVDRIRRKPAFKVPCGGRREVGVARPAPARKVGGARDSSDARKHRH